MTALYQTELPIRREIIDAHSKVVDGWRRPGTWWTGAERRAIVDQVRAARDLGADLPAWTPPTTVEGLVPETQLPDAAVDVVWRLTNHPGTLTRDWYATIVPEHLDEGKYAELVAIVAQANNIDRFADALSLERPSLGDPIEGEPSRAVPDDISVTTHWVPTTGSGPNVVKALSSVPAEVDAWQSLGNVQYVPGGALLGDLSSRHGALERVQIELIAARTSKLNECFY